MTLPLRPPIEPMLAKNAARLPDGEWWFEPKWDGFRCLVFVDDDGVTLQSRNGKPFNRYFVELPEPLAEATGGRAVLDTELVVPGAAGLDFDLLSQRIHPAESRVEMLARTTPAQVIVFDLLAEGDRDLTGEPFRERRARLEEVVSETDVVHRSLVTDDRQVAGDWFERFEGAGLDGVVAKDPGQAYLPGQRGWVKVKPRRTIDCVVAGYRIHKDGEGVGSLLLGLHDDEGRLHHVGVAASFTATRRRELVEELAPLVLDDPSEHPWGEWADAAAHTEGRLPGGPSRWNQGKDLSWTPVRPDRVAEVGFTQLTAGRFRHSAKFLRWRPDRDPASARYDQLEVPPPAELADVLGAGRSSGA